jgi:hypothetical protein
MRGRCRGAPGCGMFQDAALAQRVPSHLQKIGDAGAPLAQLRGNVLDHILAWGRVWRRGCSRARCSNSRRRSWPDRITQLSKSLPGFITRGKAVDSSGTLTGQVTLEVLRQTFVGRAVFGERAPAAAQWHEQTSKPLSVLMRFADPVLSVLVDGVAKDLVVVDQLRRPAAPCEWLESGQIKPKRSSAALLRRAVSSRRAAAATARSAASR